jgi:hypothetical protein
MVIVEVLKAGQSTPRIFIDTTTMLFWLIIVALEKVLASELKKIC